MTDWNDTWRMVVVVAGVLLVAGSVQAASVTSASLSEVRCLENTWDPGETSSELVLNVPDDSSTVEVQGRPFHSNILGLGRPNGYEVDGAVSVQDIDGTDGLQVTVEITNTVSEGQQSPCRASFDAEVKEIEDLSGIIPVVVDVTSLDADGNTFASKTWEREADLPGSNAQDGDEDQDDDNRTNNDPPETPPDTSGQIPQPGKLKPDLSWFEKNGQLVFSGLQLATVLVSFADVIDGWASDSGFVSGEEPNSFSEGVTQYADTQSDLNLVVSSLKQVLQLAGVELTPPKNIQTQSTPQGVDYGGAGNPASEAGSGSDAMEEVVELNGGCVWSDAVGESFVQSADLPPEEDRSPRLQGLVENPNQCVDLNHMCDLISDQDMIWDVSNGECLPVDDVDGECNTGADYTTMTYEDTFDGDGKYWNSRLESCTHWSVDKPCGSGDVVRFDIGSSDPVTCSSSGTYSHPDCPDGESYESGSCS